MKRLVVVCIVMLASTAYAEPTEINEEEATSGIRESEGTTTGQMQGLNNQAEFWTNHGVSLVTSTMDFIHAFRALTDPDANCLDLGDVGAPQVPTSCAGSETCGECFTHAQNQLNGMRLNLERLRCVYRAAADFTRASIAFGDSASGIHAVTGLEWQTQKAGIVQAFESLKHTYDVKYGQMLPNLRGALESIGQCEAQFFHNNDWYDRFGFIYYTFMADRYKRSD